MTQLWIGHSQNFINNFDLTINFKIWKILGFFLIFLFFYICTIFSINIFILAGFIYLLCILLYAVLRRVYYEHVSYSLIWSVLLLVIHNDLSSIDLFSIIKTAPPPPPSLRAHAYEVRSGISAYTHVRAFIYVDYTYIYVYNVTYGYNWQYRICYFEIGHRYFYISIFYIFWNAWTQFTMINCHRNFR